MNPWPSAGWVELDRRSRRNFDSVEYRARIGDSGRAVPRQGNGSPNAGRHRMHGNDHGAFVNAWLATAAKNSSTEQLVRLFEDAFSAMWARAHVILGEVTLTAILDRVLYSSAERHPPLSALRVEPTGLQFERFREQSGGLPPPEIEAALQTTLVEFLSVLGNLTAEILTPALHAALTGVEPVSGAENAEVEDET